MFPQKPYEAANRSHMQFRSEFVYLNALYYLVVSCKDTLNQKLVEDLKKGGIAVGMVTHAISKSQVQSVIVYSSDAEKMANDFDGFINLTNQQAFVSSHRMLTNYFHHLLKELVELESINLKSSDIKQLDGYSLSSKSILRIYKSIGIDIANDAHETTQLKRHSATRNIIEHNNGVANSEYIMLTGYDLSVGDLALTNSKEVGEALAITEHVVQNVNSQALEKWPNLIT